jgi:Domain of unknown function (DUF4129)
VSRWIFFVAAVLLAAALTTQPALAAGRMQYAPPGDYAARISAALAAVHDAQRASGATRAHKLAAARALLPPHVSVQLGGVRVHADLGTVRGDLATGHLARAAARLAALRTALDAPAARLSAPNQHNLAALDGILSRPPFVSPPDFWTALGRFLQRLVLHSPLGAIINAISRLLHSLLGSAAGPVETVLPIVAGLIVAAVLVFAAHRSFGTFVPHAALADEDREQERRLDAAGARARAAALAAAGDYREAARYVFLSTLLALDEAGRLRVDVTTGNRDVLRQARAVPHLAEALTPVVRWFELFWFGHAPVTRQDYERYRALNERALEVAR